ncbi:hypothetical protein CROQUDRAFT_697325 [Cronartium quercuum f. sp. fusiforme G11]|uniref:Restriction of telomere capping protein 4 C-terminal domain-containing protein n=1 Tax=Cronartium quercuum f. sp. fusiforme G11 TaxID=708437 RepID=A0A9P6T545_9BASI|nr:hypothetical protein CROQUDRAFT_697325 [Cronartium quercuum f. sp. fusiforme G11]
MARLVCFLQTYVHLVLSLFPEILLYTSPHTPNSYGGSGHGIPQILNTLEKLFLPGTLEILTKAQAAPLSHTIYLTWVLLPEVALHLIAEDLRLPVTDSKVMEVLKTSHAYGCTQFPDPDGNDPSIASECSTNTNTQPVSKHGCPKRSWSFQNSGLLHQKVAKVARGG